VSAFREAARACMEADLVCRCGAENIPGKPPDITLDDALSDRAGCSVCGRYGPIASFTRKAESRQ
jgi:hypothetical protein